LLYHFVWVSQSSNERFYCCLTNLSQGFGCASADIINQFQRINMLEILPGDSHTYAHERLGPPEMEYLITLKQRYKGQIKLTIPRWKAGAPDLPSCALGKKFECDQNL